MQGQSEDQTRSSASPEAGDVARKQEEPPQGAITPPPTPWMTPFAVQVPRNGLRGLLVLAAVVATVAVLYILRGVVLPLFLAFLLAYALNPIVTWLARHKIPRALGGPLVMVTIFALIGLTLTYGIPFLVAEIRDASADLPAQILRAEKRIEPWLWSEFKVKPPSSLSEITQHVLSRIQPASTSGSGVAGTIATAVFGTLGYVAGVLSALIVPIFTIYLLMDFDSIIDKAKELIPRRWAPGVVDLFAQIHNTLGNWMRGQFTANLVLGALYATGLRVVDIRLAVPIGVLTGMLGFVPYVGFGLGLLLALSMATLDWQGPGRPLAVLAVMLGVQLLDGLVITPRIVGRSVGLEPLEVLLTLMAAGTLFGFVGVFLAVPLGAIFKILVTRAVRAYFASEFYRRARA